MSAYVIDEKKYQKFLAIILSILSNPQTKEVASNVTWYASETCGLNRQDFDFNEKSALRFVSDMIRVNYESVGYRYREDAEPLEMRNDQESLETVRANHTWGAYAKPADYLTVSRFLDCWHYQSCEHTPDAADQKLFEAVKGLQCELLETGLKKAASYPETSWGELPMSFEKDGKQPQVLSLSELARGKSTKDRV